MVTLPRLAEEPLARLLEQFRVVAVLGARQVGKSTLVERIPGRHLVTLDDLGALTAARSDPRAFVSALPTPATIDEVQRVPELILAIKERVDRERRRGAFLLTGSSRIDTLRGIRESLAGRVAPLILRPMTFGELRSVRGNPVVRLVACEDAADAAQTHARLVTRARVTSEVLLTGGFPEPALAHRPSERAAWFRAYRQTYVERDVPPVLRVEDLPAFVRFLYACAASSAGVLNTTDLARDIGASLDTARRWLAVLETTFLVERLVPYWRNIRKRLVKSPKLYLADSGMTAALLGLDATPAEGASSLYAGPLLETWVHAQLRAYADLADPPVELHFYRTHSQVEVDFVLARGPRLVAVEVKHGTTIGPSDARGIESFVAQFPKACRFGAVLYGGDQVFPLSAHAVAIPLTAMFGGEER